MGAPLIDARFSNELSMSIIRGRSRRCLVRFSMFSKKLSKTGPPSFDEPVLESPNTPEATKRALFLHWPARTGPWPYRNTAHSAPQPKSLLPSRHAPRCKKVVQNRTSVDMCPFAVLAARAVRCGGEGNRRAHLSRKSHQHGRVDDPPCCWKGTTTTPSLVVVAR